MGTLPISLIISPDGNVSARSWRANTGKDGTRRVDLAGLDGRVLRVFERLLMEHDRVWDRDEIRVFGQLLHLRLFPPEVWKFVEDQVRDRGEDVVRLQLAFPTDAASSRLAALPWEYLCTQDSDGTDGRPLVLTPGLLLSRSVPPGTPPRPVVETDRVTVLPVVGDASSAHLGVVHYQPALESIEVAGARAGFHVLDPAIEVTRDELGARVAADRPHVVHYVGHGRFTPDTGTGALALVDDEGSTRWVDEAQLADELCSDEWTPAIVVLHACEGGRNDYGYRHAGLAPGLVRAGVQCVVAMQYRIAEAVADLFTASLYQALADGQALDEAVQTARLAIWQRERDARLLGMPMVYQRTATPLLSGRAGPGVR